MHLAYLVFATLLMAAGCNQPDSGPDPHPTTMAPGHAVAEDFEAWTDDSVARGWTTHGGTWRGAANASQPAHARVASGAGADALNILVADVAGSFGDFEANVTFDVIAGEHPQGAGLAFHFQDDANYQIIRYSMSEQGWHLFTVHEGNRDKQPDGTVLGPTTNPTFHEWVSLRVVSLGRNVQAYHGTVLVIDYALPAYVAGDGAVGLFVRGNTVAQFDDFTVRPL